MIIGNDSAIALSAALFDDEDKNDSLDVYFVDAPGWLWLDGNTVRGTPGEEALGVHAYTVEAADRSGALATTTVSITVVDAVAAIVQVAEHVSEGAEETARLASLLHQIDGLAEFPRHLHNEFARLIRRQNPAPETVAELAALADRLVQRATAQPTVQLRLRQGGGPVTRVRRVGGPVEVVAVLDNVDPGPGVLFDWSDSDSAVLAGAAIATPTTRILAFDPSALPVSGHRRAKVRVEHLSFQSNASLVVAVAERGAAATSLQDSDGDGVSDDHEGSLDADLDPAQANKLQTLAGEDHFFVMEAEDERILRLGAVARTNETNQTTVTLEHMAEHFGVGATAAINALPTSRALNESQILDFEIAALPRVGANTRVVIPLRTPLKARAKYATYRHGVGWDFFKEDGLNAVYSAPAAGGSLGTCPGVTSSAYAPGLNAGSSCVLLRIEDGGANDVDLPSSETPGHGEINGNVRSLGAIVYDNRQFVVSAGHSGAGASGALFAALFAIALVLRRQRRQLAIVAAACFALTN